MKAYCLIREAPWYRREAFVSGLRAAGHDVQLQQPQRMDRDTLLIIWNRYAGNHDLALAVERAGGKVIVAENGYLGAGGTSPKFDVHPGGPQPHHQYALELGFHNDETRVSAGGPERFAALGVEIKPWRTGGDYVLVCPNRSFGVPRRSMHPDWAENAARRVRKQTSLPVKIRAHPGNNAPKRPLAEDLTRARAVVIWSSSSGVHALLEGIPVFVEAPYWVMKSAGASGTVEAPVMPERRPCFERMAWAQWRIEEIADGSAFRHLLPAAG